MILDPIDDEETGDVQKRGRPRAPRESGYVPDIETTSLDEVKDLVYNDDYD